MFLIFSQIICGTHINITKVVNYSHMFPTRYSVELEGLKGILSAESFKEVSQREDSKKQVKKLLEERYSSGKNKWFFQSLRVCGHHLYPLPHTDEFYSFDIFSCWVPVSRKATCMPRMSPIIYALHCHTPNNTGTTLSFSQV
jgi:hypothetical protein